MLERRRERREKKDRGQAHRLTRCGSAFVEKRKLLGSASAAKDVMHVHATFKHTVTLNRNKHETNTTTQSAGVHKGKPG